MTRILHLGTVIATPDCSRLWTITDICYRYCNIQMWNMKGRCIRIARIERLYKAIREGHLIIRFDPAQPSYMP